MTWTLDATQPGTRAGLGWLAKQLAAHRTIVAGLKHSVTGLVFEKQMYGVSLIILTDNSISAAALRRRQDEIFRFCAEGYRNQCDLEITTLEIKGQS